MHKTVKSIFIKGRFTHMNSQNVVHSLSLSDRHVLKITAVSDVINFDETNVSMAVGDTVLNVSGTELSVSSLSLENGEVVLCGSIDAIVYLENTKSRKKGLGRLFGA